MTIHQINDNPIDLPADMEAILDMGAGGFDFISYKDYTICTFEEGNFDEDDLYIGPFGIFSEADCTIREFESLAAARAYCDANPIAR